MGHGSSTHLQPFLLLKLEEETSFDGKEIRELYRFFRERCMESSDPMKMSKGVFEDIFLRVYPRTDCGPFVDHVYRVMNSESSKSFSFHDFLCSLEVILKGTFAEKIHWVFKLLDINSDGKASAVERKAVTQSLFELQPHLVSELNFIPETFINDESLLRIFEAQNEDIDILSFEKTISSNILTKRFVEAVIKAAGKPYWDQKGETGSFGTRRMSTVVNKSERSSSQGSTRSRSMTVS